jgi:hypothetical protein
MKKPRWKQLATVAGTAALITLLTACGKQQEAKVDKAMDKAAAEVQAKADAVAKAAEAAAREAESLALATEAYVYAYPLITMEMTRRVMTNVEKPEGTRAPMGQFVRARTYPNASFRDVTAPNADTLYTTTWLDVTQEPWILNLPDMKGRYFLFSMLDGWTNVFQVPGKRTTGTKAQKIAITGPGWTGTPPAGVTEYKSPTGMVWILGRIYSTGTPQDYKEVHALQDQVSVVPLSSYGKPFKPEAGKVDAAIDMNTAVREQVNAMDGAAYFKLFAELLKTNPPTAEDAPMVAKLGKIGIVPGPGFRHDQARTRGRQGNRRCAQAGAGRDHGMDEGRRRCRRHEVRERVALHDQDRPLWHRLPSARAHHRDRPGCQPATGRRVSDLRGNGHSEEVQRREKVRDAVREGPAAASRWTLVTDDVRQGLLLRRQPAQPVQREPAQRAEGQPRWLDRPVHPARIARQGQGIELAAGAEGPVHPDAAHVLAEREAAFAADSGIVDDRTNAPLADKVAG